MRYCHTITSEKTLVRQESRAPDRLFRTWICFFPLALAIAVVSITHAPLVTGAESGTAGASSPPNILFVLVDDMGWGDLGVFFQNDSKHEKKHRTPHLDALARSGIQLRAHYCPAPVCAPSRSSLLTGVHQGNAVVRDNQFDKELEDNHTLGSVLQAAGYQTCLIGKYGLQGGTPEKHETGTPQDWPSFPTQRGFDEFFGYVSHRAGHLHYPNDPWKMGNEGHTGTVNLWQSDSRGDREISEQLGKCYTTDLFTARAKHFITSHRESHADQPFFLYLAYDTPHAALQIPTVAYPEGGGLRGGMQWLGKPNQMISTATGEVDSYRHPDYTNKGWTDMEERFATMVRRIDSSLHDLQQLLEDLGIAEQTLVVFTSDNGPHREAYVKGDGWGNGRYKPTSFRSYGPYDGIKRDCWEGGIRVPTFAWWPNRIPAGAVNSSPSQFHDWMATFCDVAGVPAPARCDGVSLAPTLLGNGKQTTPTTYIEYKNGGKTPGYDDFLNSRHGGLRRQMQVIRMAGQDGKNYKGVRYDIQSHDDPFEIYDVEADPGERSDLAGSNGAMIQLHRQMKNRVLQVRSPNPSAPRPYDDAPIPPLMNSAAKDQPHPIEEVQYESADVDWVPQTNGLRQIASRKLAGGTRQEIQYQSLTPGTFGLRVLIHVREAGHYKFSLQSNAPCFVRLHEGHAFDLQEPNSTAETITRHLQAGVHPLQIVTTSTSEPAKITLSWSK